MPQITIEHLYDRPVRAASAPLTLPSMDSPVEGRSRRRVHGTLSRRQMEILALIAAGRTNAEIAAHLGISLSGAKYHVSQILSSLEVDTREEAADWWRRENGLAYRLRRLSAGLTAVGIGRWVAATSLVSSIGAVTLLVLVTLSIGGGSEPTEDTSVSAFEPTADCPVSETICAFAARTRDAVQQGDAQRILAGSQFAAGGNDPAGLGETIEKILRTGAGEPTLASIGCPILDDEPDCDQAFSLAFKAHNVAPNDESGVLLLSFTVADDHRPFLASIAVPEAVDRWPSAFNGGTSGSCFSSGYSAYGFEGECVRTEFLLMR